MSIDLQDSDLNKFILVGDRVLIKPKNSPDQTRSGLYLPPGVQENEKIHSGYVIKVGPGYPIPGDIDQEPWMEKKQHLKYIPLHAFTSAFPFSLNLSISVSIFSALFVLLLYQELKISLKIH